MLFYPLCLKATVYKSNLTNGSYIFHFQHPGSTVEHTECKVLSIIRQKFPFILPIQFYTKNVSESK